MVKIKAKDTIYGSVILILIVSMGIVLTNDNVEDLYYCPLDNIIKECTSLSKYGIADSVCKLTYPEPNRASVRCQEGRTYAAWTPLSEHLNLSIKTTPHVESLQDCEIEYFNETVRVNITCNYTHLVPYDCKDPKDNSTCKWKNETVYYKCGHKDVVKTFNRTVCTPLGFKVVYPKMNYTITGACCGYYEKSPYKQYLGSRLISCGQAFLGECNPILQQTSKDSTEFDQVGRIYIIGKESVKPVLVGQYPYIENYDVKISEMKVKYQVKESLEVVK